MWCSCHTLRLAPDEHVAHDRPEAGGAQIDRNPLAGDGDALHQEVDHARLPGGKQGRLHRVELAQGGNHLPVINVWVFDVPDMPECIKVTRQHSRTWLPAAFPTR